MNEHDDDWADLQDTWGATAPAALPDVAPMIARARRQRRTTIWMMASEWALVVVAVALVIGQWPKVRGSALMIAWCVYCLLLTAPILAVVTWTRLAALNEPAGASLRDWLLLRRRRARLGLRLARITRWSVVAMLPAPLVAFATSRTAWSATWGVVAMLLMLASYWWWARRRRMLMERELAEVDALARDWLGEDLAPTA